MFWLGPRVFIALLGALGGLWAGQELGNALGWPRVGAAMGVGVSVLLVAALDSWRGARLLGWLSGAMDTAPPRLSGFWGEACIRVERALRQRERESERERDRLTQFLAAIEASPNGVLLLDANEQIAWCSSVAAEHLGLDPQRDLRQRITNLVRAPAFVAQLQARQHEQPVQIPGARGQGQLLVLLRAYGEGQRLVLTQDITDRERADATRRDFVANVSHEIRTPLTVLAGFVETMGTLPLTEVERARVLTLMGQQTRRMQALVGDLLTLARLEDSPRPAHDAWAPMSRLGGAVEAEARGLSGEAHTLSFDWGDGVELAGSEPELQSAIANLVVNAVRYTPPGGRVSVGVVQRDDGGVDIQVKDSGPGIAAEHLPRLTERFYRVDNSRSRDTGGTGLGLAIVKHVVQRHGGELRIASELGRGSVFTVSLPAMRVRPMRTTWDSVAQG